MSFESPQIEDRRMNSFGVLTTSPISPISPIPQWIFTLILTHLKPADLWNSASTSKYWFASVLDDRLWKPYLKQIKFLWKKQFGKASLPDQTMHLFQKQEELLRILSKCRYEPLSTYEAAITSPCLIKDFLKVQTFEEMMSFFCDLWGLRAKKVAQFYERRQLQFQVQDGPNQLSKRDRYVKCYTFFFQSISTQFIRSYSPQTRWEALQGFCEKINWGSFFPPVMFDASLFDRWLTHPERLILALNYIEKRSHCDNPRVFQLTRHSSQGNKQHIQTIWDHVQSENGWWKLSTIRKAIQDKIKKMEDPTMARAIFFPMIPFWIVNSYDEGHNFGKSFLVWMVSSIVLNFLLRKYTMYQLKSSYVPDQVFLMLLMERWKQESMQLPI